MIVVNYKYCLLSQMKLNKILYQQSSSLNEGIVCDKLIGMKLLPDNDQIVESSDSYWDRFKPDKI